MEDIENKDVKKVHFSVDAGLINRLGKELVGRAETAVSELVKNAYDADARQVTINFIDASDASGTLTIEDDGHGMTYEQLIDGFLRIASVEKVRHPSSPKFERQRAGRKGIGRFATQMLGEELVVETQAEGSNSSLMLTIDWNQYQPEIDLSVIENSIERKPAFEDVVSGTKLTIKKLREPWSEAKIKRIFRYVSALLQPEHLSESSRKNNLANRNDQDSQNSFNVSFYRSENNDIITIADIDKIFFDAAIAEIQGFVVDGKAICEVNSELFEVKDEIELEGDYSEANDTYFKVYYYIFGIDVYDRYYKGRISKPEFNKLDQYAKDNSGVKLYRNGFRVLPYGEIGDDWLKIDKAYIKGHKEDEFAYVPFNNRSFLGYIEINDPLGEKFEETASREGLIENKAFESLKSFVYSALLAATRRVNAARVKKKRVEEEKKIPEAKERNIALPIRIENLIRTKQNELETISESPEGSGQKRAEIEHINEEINVLQKAKLELEEKEMMRVLAGVGLTIAEFTHEVRQFIPIFNSGIALFSKEAKNQDSITAIKDLRKAFSRFNSYVKYIDETMINNTSRHKLPIKLNKIIKDFKSIVDYDAEEDNIVVTTDIRQYDLVTIPMHPSEWNSLLYNLYTNAKKAISKAAPTEKRIKIVGGRAEQMIYLEFMDNGIGVAEDIKSRIFDAFFTTSTPAYTTSRKKAVIGTGLGLKIVKDIVEGYNGKIYLVEPEHDYSTCFRIELPEHKDN